MIAHSISTWIYIDNTLFLFVALVEKWYTDTNAKDDIIFDNSKPIAFQKDLIEKLRDMSVDETSDVNPLDFICEHLQ